MNYYKGYDGIALSCGAFVWLVGTAHQYIQSYNSSGAMLAAPMDDKYLETG